MERRLVAILAADMVGYSKLMAADETGTIEQQKAHRAALIDRQGGVVGAYPGPAEWDGPEARVLIEHYLRQPASAAPVASSRRRMIFGEYSRGP